MSCASTPPVRHQRKLFIESSFINGISHTFELPCHGEPDDDGNEGDGSGDNENNRDDQKNAKWAHAGFRTVTKTIQ